MFVYFDINTKANIRLILNKTNWINKWIVLVWIYKYIIYMWDSVEIEWVILYIRYYYIIIMIKKYGSDILILVWVAKEGKGVVFGLFEFFRHVFKMHCLCQIRYSPDFLLI